MSQIVKNFIEKVNEQFQTGHAREHSYRPALEELFKEITGLKVINEPKRSEYGAPDFVFINKNIVTAYAEAKDLKISLNEIEKSDQMVRYYGYSNLILTNCLEFRFYKSGQSYTDPINIATLKDGDIVFDEAKFKLLEATIKDFIKDSKEPIKSGIHLAKVMAGKARRIRDNIKNYLGEEDQEKNTELLAIYEVIKKLLLADLDKEKFSDMYAQTVVYGLFVARYFDKSPDTFSRQEARDLVPASNPFLRHFFDHIAGSSFDERIKMIVDELCEEFCHADVQAIVHNYYKVEKEGSRDPIIHFYEDFLQEYDSAERKKMGVFYTPIPVVQFIVRAVDDILKKEFNLPQGLADTAKIEMEVAVQAIDGRTKDGIKKIKQQFHKVQILDPATGTGTFLNETILHIKKSFTGQEGRWNNYVSADLLPRLHGFELMMASYTIAHLKLSTTIMESGADIGNGRLGVYLTNTLEETKNFDNTLFAGLGLDKAITEESRLANKVKKDLPVMVVLGNPPYSGESNNNFEHANKLVDKYKVEPGGVEKLKERNPKWLNDDYVKFIAFSEGLIEKNGEGILGFITNHSYLDNPTFRGMRWKLAQTFDEIYIIDLHGNAKKKEKHPDGSKDENVFAIQQGVAIMIALKRKNKEKKNDASVFVADIYGKKADKFTSLNNGNVNYKKINLDAKQYYFVDKNIDGKDEYEKGFSVSKLFLVQNVGVVTSADSILIAKSKEELLKQLYEAKEENSAKKTIQKLKSENIEENKIKPITYRPFDNQFIYYEPKIIERARYEVMKNFIDRENFGLIFKRGGIEEKSAPVYISKFISESRSWSRPGMQGIESLAPLYLYADAGEQYKVGNAGNITASRIPNLDLIIARNIASAIGAVYYPVVEYPTKDGDKRLTPENILDYIYAALHSPSYREKYKEFLMIDFPRVPHPKNYEHFFSLVALGQELRELHFLESPKLNKSITTYPEVGNDTIEKKYPLFKDSKVYINDVQYFGNVPLIAWDFYIGGYQPAQKWLKDRRERKLSNNDIEHYQKMIIALMETDRITKEIDKIF